MMLKKPEPHLKSKFSNDFTSHSVCYGITNTQRLKSRPKSSSVSIHPNSLKQVSGRVSVFRFENIFPPIEFHPWESKYNKVFTRQKIQKAMTKDSYTQPKRLIVHANETIATEEECLPPLTSARNIQIEKPIIHKEKKKSFLPTIVRYVRNDDNMSSELFVQQISTKKSLIVDTNLKMTHDRLPSRISPLAIRLSSLKLTMETIPEETHEYYKQNFCY